MKTLHTIMVLIAIASLPAFIGVQQAMAGSTGATGSVTISGTCEIVAGSMTFAGGDPTLDCATCGSPGVGQLTVNLANTNGNLQSVTQVLGANWLDSQSPFDPVQDVSNTKFSATTGTFASKADLSGTLATLVTVPVASNSDTFWDVEIDLDLDGTFAGTANQAITFDFACIV